MKDIIRSVEGLDDETAVKLFRHVGRTLFGQPEIRALLESGAGDSLADALSAVPLKRKRESLSVDRSIWLARILLTTLASDPRFAKIVAKAMKTRRKDELIVEATFPRGLATDVVRLLASVRGADAQITASSGERFQADATAAPKVTVVILEAEDDPLARLAAVALDPAEPPHTPAGAEKPLGTIFGEAAGPTDGGVSALRTRARAGARPGERRDGATAAESDLPRTMYALAEAPRHVVMSEPFTLRAGTTDLPPAPGAQPMERPSSSVGEYTLTLTLQAIGFEVEHDDSVFELRATRAKPYPNVEIRLTPSLQAEERLERDVTIFFSIDGQVIGTASLHFVVHQAPGDETRAAQAEVWTRIFSTPTFTVPPDMTVLITDDGHGNLAWSFITPHKEVLVPRKPLPTIVGDDTRAFAERLVNQVNRRAPTVGVYDFLVGIGKTVTEKTPGAFWALLKAAASAAKTTSPSLLIISSEPYMPWELAVMREPLDRAVGPFLGAQVRVGRWIVGDRIPPPRSVVVRSAAVISGTYAIPGWKTLKNALDEAAEIIHRWNAIGVDATEAAILALLKTTPISDVLHFAMHGQCDDDGTLNGLITTDGSAVAPMSVAGALRRDTPGVGMPFVFLNACQVGTGIRMLGDYSGMAAEFVKGGAAAVVAPLWSIADDVAKQVALEFYEATLVRGELPAEVIRRERALFREGTSPTYLAYQFFGHPSLAIDGTGLTKGAVGHG